MSENGEIPCAAIWSMSLAKSSSESYSWSGWLIDDFVDIGIDVIDVLLERPITRFRLISSIPCFLLSSIFLTVSRMFVKSSD